jgi:hypothetical protein
MSVNNCPVCPSGCSAILPDLDFNFCSPENAFGEITHIFVAAYDASCFSDEALLGEWLGRLDNSGGDIESIRYMHVKATKPVGSFDTIETSLGRKVKSPGSYTLNIEIDDVSPLNHEFMRLTQCNTTFKIWYAAGGFLWGGHCGIDAILNLDYQIDAGMKTIHKITGTALWEASCSPERVINPLDATILTA